MTQEKGGEPHCCEAPKVDLAAEAPELYRRGSDGLQVSLKAPYEDLSNAAS